MMKTKIALLVAMLILGSSIETFSQQTRKRDGGTTPTQSDRDNRGEKRSTSGNENHDKNKDNHSNGPHDQDNIRVNRNTVVFKRSPRAVVVRNVPEGYAVCHHRDRDYYANSGRYYEYNNGRYIVVAPPVGLRVNILPIGCIRVAVAAASYFYLNGIFYSNVGDNNYEIVDPPMGAIVYMLPDDAEKVEINDMIYYQYSGTLYRKVYTDNGKAFKVVGKLDD
jgi:hypothetical protein